MGMNVPEKSLEEKMKKLAVLVLLVGIILTSCNAFAKQESVAVEATRDPLISVLSTQVAELKNQNRADEIVTAPASTSSNQPAVEPEGCHIIHDSVVVETMDSISTSGDLIHLEYWYEGQPEREAIFVAAEGDGGRFMFTRPLKGWVWEYENCTYDEVYQQVQLHITRRLEGKANNAGFIDWKSTGLFKPVPLS